MIARLRERLRHDDAGITIVEVIVAMVIFAVVATGFVYTMLSVLSVTRDSRARAVAANLAAEEVDLARDAADLFALVDETRSVEINNDTFHVTRRTSWVTNPDEEFNCGGAGGIGAAAGSNLRYKRVNVTVTWDGMRPSTDPVRSDTVINPDSRINDPTLGTIIVSVLNGAGTGSQGVSVSTSPSAGAAIASTDSQGCSYVLKVTPKSYTVTVSRSGYVDSTQQATSSQTVSVVAGQSTTVAFQYDRSATFNTRMASTAPTGLTVRVPTNLQTTFTNTYGDFNRTPTGGSGTRSQAFPLHPFSTGYQAFAGTCPAANPSKWPEQVVGAQTFRADLPPAQAALGGAATTVDVPMGLVTVAGGGSGTYLRAELVDVTGPGLPALCNTTQSLTFGNVLGGSPTTIALPYGTWKLYRGGSTSQTTLVPAASIAPLAPAVPERTLIASDGAITFDPRVAVVAP
ncbi:prepilin-type N-terminal cleavage/methylation domain-containing protein [Cellulomonas sp. Y8]|uniref:type IV pilus modification PilV family protein n=1 Tax=Cellulomonas sp. Y8 TaxID=2591145 RepID=UPI003D704F6F